MSHPFGLTGPEAQLMDAIVKTGCQKTAARQLGISIKAMDGRVQRIRKKIGAPGRIRYLIEWDRATRSQT